MSISSRDIVRASLNSACDTIRDPARLAFVLASSSLLSLAIVGLPLAIFGWFRPAPVLILGIALWPFVARKGFSLTRLGVKLDARLLSTAALVIAAAFGWFATGHSSEHLLTDRDPGVYLVTGKWLAEHGTLVYDTGLPPEIVKTLTRPESWSSQGIHPGPAGTSYFQFQHMTDVVLATTQWLGGDWLMFRTSGVMAAVALLGLFLLGRRLVGGAWALLPLIAAAVHPAFVHVSKDTYSEWIALIFIASACLVWLEIRRQSRSRSFYVGLLFGAATLARIDGWLAVVGFLSGLAYLRAAKRRADAAQPFDGHLLLGLVPLGLLSIADLILRSPRYLSDLIESWLPLLALTVLGGSAVLLARRLPAGRDRHGMIRRMVVPVSLSAIVLVGGLYGLFVRPVTQQVRDDTPNGLVANLQAREGLEVDPYRTYAEQSLNWIAQYQGHVSVAAAILLLSAVVYVITRRRFDRRTPVLTILLAAATVYLWRPSITPDHLWAMRRFIPVILPLSFVFAALSARLVHRIARRHSAVAVPLAALIATGISFAVAVGWPVAAIRTQIGMATGIQQICDTLGDGSVAFLDDSLAPTLMGAVRTYCGVPTTSLSEPGLWDRVERSGLKAVAISSSRECGEYLGHVELSYQFPERRLSSPPRQADRSTLAVYSTRRPAAYTASAEVPQGAQAFLEIEASTTWRPSDGSSLLATLGDYLAGIWIEYRPGGLVELWAATDHGPVSILLTRTLDDGKPRTLGGYVEGDTLVGTCAGQSIGSVELPGTLVVAHPATEVAPLGANEFANHVFRGKVVILRAGLAGGVAAGDGPASQGSVFALTTSSQ